MVGVYTYLTPLCFHHMLQQQQLGYGISPPCQLQHILCVQPRYTHCHLHRLQGCGCQQPREMMEGEVLLLLGRGDGGVGGGGGE